MASIPMLLSLSHVDLICINANMGFSGGSDSTESAGNAGDLDLIPESGRSPGEENDCPLQYSYIENSKNRGARTNLDSALERDITLLTKVCTVKAMDFPVVMYGCESWTIKKAENRRTDTFQLWCWRRLLRVPWIGSKEIKPVNPKGNQP